MILPNEHLRRPLAFYAALGLLTLTLGLARFDLGVGAWYHTYHPPEVSLLAGWPASWEAVYYTDEFPNFLGNAPTRFGIAPVHYRTYLTLYLTTVIYALTGSAYWSFAAVDLFFWWLASVATYHLARRLRASEVGAVLSALLVVASPLLVSHMWREDLHPANFASLPLGAWAAVTLIDEQRRSWRLSAALGVLLVWLSLSYQYQWVMVPLLFVLLLGQRQTRLPQVGAIWRAALVTAGAVALYLMLTAGLQTLFAQGVGPPTESNNVAAQPGSMLVERLLGTRSLSDVVSLVPSRYYRDELVRSYHPAVLVAGIIGVALLGPTVAVATLIGLAVSLVSLTYYSAPWAATSAYPFVYIGAGTACATLGNLVAHAMRRLPLWPKIERCEAERAQVLGAAGVLGVGVAVASAVLLAAQTNLDLFGYPGFLLTWWQYFGGRYLF